MADYNKKKMLEEFLIKISNESTLTYAEAIEIINDGNIPIECLKFLSKKMMEMANRGEHISIIKVEVYSIMSQISIAGGLDNYQQLKS